jgi:RNA polymerase sigma factor for flagellar operon FliA
VDQLPVSLVSLPDANACVAAAPEARSARRQQAAPSGAAPYAGAPVTEESLQELLPMVRFLALRIRERLPQHVEMEDLVSAGVVGLMDAIHKFNPDRKVQFRTYAQFRVRGAMLDSLRALDWGPRDLRRKAREVEAAIRTLGSSLGKAPSEAEIADELGLDLQEYQHLLGELSGLELSSLNETYGEDGGEEALAMIAAGPEDDPFLQCQSSEMRGKLAEAVAALPAKERMVLTLYYYEELTMREVGAVMGVGESRISQLHSAAMARLRTALRAHRAGSGARL